MVARTLSSEWLIKATALFAEIEPGADVGLVEDLAEMLPEILAARRARFSEFTGKYSDGQLCWAGMNTGRQIRRVKVAKSPTWPEA